MGTGAGQRLLAWIAAAALLLLVGLPLAFVLLQAIFPELGRGSLAAPFSALLRTFEDPRLARLTGNTLLLGMLVTGFAGAVAIPLGVLRALFLLPLAPLWDLLFLVPFLIPPYIAALGWTMLLQPRGYLDQLLGIDAAAFLFSPVGIATAMALTLFPVVYFAVSRTVASVGSRFADVGRVFGAGPATAFLRVTLPLSVPGIAASLLLVFALAIEEFGAPAALGGQAGFYVLATGIERRFADFPIDVPGAATLSLILVALAATAFLLQHWLATRRSFAVVSGKPQDASRRPLGPWSAPVLALFAAMALVAVLLPLFSIFATAFSRTISGGLAADNLSLAHFAAIAADRSGALGALGTSLALALVTALVTGLVGALTAYCIVRTRLAGRILLDLLAALPNAAPGIVVAVGIILAWNQRFWPVSPYNTPAILVLAYACLLVPYPIRYASASLRQVGESLDAAARVCGASPATLFRRVLLPLMMPSLLAAMLLVFAVASRELVASLLLAPAGTRTIATFIWRQFEQGSVGDGMAMSGIAIAINLAIPLTIWLWQRRFGHGDGLPFK